MRKYFVVGLLVLPMVLAAAPVAQKGRAVSRPVTEEGVFRPTTQDQGGIVRHTTKGAVVHPTTTDGVVRPTTESKGGNAASGAGSAAPAAATSSSKKGKNKSGSSAAKAGDANKAAPISNNITGLSKVKEDVPSDPLLDAARNKVDLSGNLQAIAPKTNISEKNLSKNVKNEVNKNNSNNKKK